MNDINKDEIDARWHMLVWRMMIVICSISFVIAWILFGVYRVDKSIGAGAYIVKYIVLPMIVQAIAITICYFYMKHDEADIKHKNYVVTGMIYVCVGVIAFTYCTIYPLILIPCVTIIATALFADQELTVWSGVAVLALMVINVVRLHLNVGELATQMNWVGALLIYILVVSVMCAMVMVVNKHTKALMESIAGSYNRQVTLMSELMVDPMTGLYNRRSFEESLDKEIENVEQTGAKSYVTIFDIDHFKEVNDTYGHSNGDIVIKALCKMMKEKSKDMGLAFRYGGEEFVILFHDVELSKVMNVVEDIRTEFRCYYFHFMNKDGITCSCGVAEYTKGESSKAWFNRADSALYKAKESGRNRTVISEIKNNTLGCAQCVIFLWNYSNVMICPALLDIIVQPLNHTVGYCLGVVLKIFIEIVQIVLVGHEAHLNDHACHIGVSDDRIVIIAVSLGSDSHPSVGGYTNFLEIAQNVICGRITALRS